MRESRVETTRDAGEELARFRRRPLAGDKQVIERRDAGQVIRQVLRLDRKILLLAVGLDIEHGAEVRG